MFGENSEREKTREGRRKQQTRGQNNSSKFLVSFSVPRLFLQAVVSRRLCDITRDDRESARAFIYIYFILYICREERDRG